MDNQRHASGEPQPPHNTLLNGPPAYAPRTPWGAVWAVIVTVAIVGVSIVAGLLLFWVMGGDSGGAGLPGRDGAAGEGAGLQFFGLWQLCVVVLTVLAALLLRGNLRDVLALHPVAGGWRTYAGAVVLLIALQLAISAVQFVTGPRDLYADLRPFVELVRGPNALLAAAVIGIGAPLSEELLFRGFLLSALAKTRLGFWGAALVTTAMWTSLHIGYTAVGILEVSIIGLFFSWLLWRTGSLRVPIFCHALYNSLIVVALRFVDLPVAG